jgi:hypothetical protein
LLRFGHSDRSSDEGEIEDARTTAPDHHRSARALAHPEEEPP